MPAGMSKVCGAEPALINAVAVKYLDSIVTGIEDVNVAAGWRSCRRIRAKRAIQRDRRSGSDTWGQREDVAMVANHCWGKLNLHQAALSFLDACEAVAGTDGKVGRSGGQELLTGAVDRALNGDRTRNAKVVDYQLESLSLCRTGWPRSRAGLLVQFRHPWLRPSFERPGWKFR